MIKIFYFLKEFYGGATTFGKIITKMNNKYIKCYAVSFEKPKNFSNKIVYLTNDYPTTFFPSLRKFILFIRNIFLSLFFINKKRPDIIMCGDNYTFILLNLCKPFIRVKPIFVLRVGAILPVINEKPYFLYRQLLLITINYLVKKTDFFICQTKTGIHDFISNFKPNKTAKIISIHNSINLAEAKMLSDKQIDIRDSHLITNQVFKIMSAGRFEKQKDFITIIKAFRHVYDKLPNTNLFLIGDGSMKKKIKELIQHLNLSNSVFLLGWKNNIYSYLKHVDLYIHSSLYEGFPFTILEAMSQKLPIISTDTPFGPRKILGLNKYGILVPIGDHNSMAIKIIYLLKSKALRKKYSILSYDRVHFFSEKRMINQYLTFFKSIYK
ncbi:glycosyltransferase [Candidatus Roizmanbacteria bacterium]|nr:glycosyltransferase [Candidatus Roizmanbacteria bacterium]